jgi:hypothetical protein
VTLITTRPTPRQLRTSIAIDSSPPVTLSPEIITAERGDNDSAPRTVRAVARGPSSDWTLKAPLELPPGVQHIDVEPIVDEGECRLIGVQLDPALVDSHKHIRILLATNVDGQPEVELQILFQ